MGGGSRVWERWFKDDVVMGMLYITTYTASRLTHVGPYHLPKTRRPQRRSPGQRGQRGISQERTLAAWGKRMMGFVWECQGSLPCIIFTNLNAPFSQATLVISSTAGLTDSKSLSSSRLASLLFCQIAPPLRQVTPWLNTFHYVPHSIHLSSQVCRTCRGEEQRLWSQLPAREFRFSVPHSVSSAARKGQEFLVHRVL